MRTISRLIVVSATAALLTACGGESSGQAVKEAASSAGEAAKSAVVEAGSAAKDAVTEAGSAAKETLAEAGATVAAAAADMAPDLAAGEQTYGRFCFSCHAAGVAGAPKLGVTDDWAPRTAKGLDALVTSTIEGIPPGMPARGLCMNCSDADLRNTVAWMMAQQ